MKNLNSMKNLNRRWKRDDRGWPKYLPGGRMRTSTAAMLLAFVVLSWVHASYEPPPAAAPETAQVVPPGFMPDPRYTWVPRTNVRTQPRTTESGPTTTTTETTSPSEGPSSTSSTSSTSPTVTTGPAPTTMVDPDGAGPLPPTAVASTSTPTTVPTTTASPAPGPGPVPTPLTPPR